MLYLPNVMRVLIVVCVFVLIPNCLTEEPPIIKVQQGGLKGSIKHTRNGKPFFAFQSIPYAEPPTGDLRFKEPIPRKPWEGILDATKEHAQCVQVNIFNLNNTYVGEEDCLYLNVYTPKFSEDELLPVIFYIHGGGFVQGEANRWEPYLLLDKDVIFVTPNYRLGALGFLSTGDEVSPGNNGLKDQSLALQWVSNNIKQFGGNPQKITIAGQSAGAASTYYHLLSPLSKDIPYAAISLSGVTPASWTLAQKGEDEKYGKRLARALNCTTDTSKEMVDCLRNAPAYDILQETINFRVFNYDPSIPFKPVVESNVAKSFLPKHPLEIIKSGQMAHIPFMTGITTDEGAMKSSGVYHYGLVKELNSRFNQILPMYIHYDEVGFDTTSTSDSIRAFYFKDNEINNETKTELTDLVTDSLFMVPARMTAALHAKYSTSPVYFYLFGYKGSTSYSQVFGDPEHDYGVSHCDDLLYLIPNNYVKYEPSVEDIKMTEVMTTIWYNFASKRDPTPNLNSLLITKWDPVISDELEYYFIKDSKTFKMDKNLYEERFQFWKTLPILGGINRLKDEL